MPLIPLMAGPSVVSGAVTLSATSSLSAAGIRDTAGTVSLGATATLTSAGVRTTSGAVSLSAAPILTSDGIRTVTGAAISLAATPTLSASAQATFFGAVSLPATSTLSSTGTGVPGGGVSLNAPSSLVVGATGEYFAAVSLTATSSLSATGGAILPAAVSLVAVSTLTANAVREVSGAVSLNVTAVLVSGAVRITSGAVSLAALSVLTADGVRVTTGAVSLPVTSTLSTDGLRTTSGAVVLAAGGSLTGTGSLPSDTPPTVVAGRARPVARGSTVVLDVIATPPASQTISGHTWTIQSGGGSLTGATTATPTYSPPASGTGLAVIRDTITASGGGSAFADVTVSYHSNVVAAENALTGIARTTWDLPTTALGGINTLQGFADGFTGNKTQTINFKIAQSDTAGWTANIYRLGYYGGLGARDYGPLNPSAGQITTSQSQPVPLDCDTVATARSSDCSNWSTTLSWTPPSWVPSGIYVLKLNRTGGGTSHVMFIIRDDARTADFMFMPADSTWNAYNAFYDVGGAGTTWYGGNSLYFGSSVDQYNTDCARYVSYNRPVVNRVAAVAGVGYGAVEYSTFFTGEYGMLRFMERNGIDTKYYGCIDAAGDSGGTLLKGNGSTVGAVKAGIFTGHNEYWSDGMRAGWESFKVAGGSVFSCAGNEVFWRLVGSANDSSGRPRTWECFKSTIAARASTGRTEWTGTWRDPDGAGKGGNNPENPFTGTIFCVNGPDFRSLVVPQAGGYSAQPLWRNTAVASLTAGQTFTSTGTEILGFEWDTYGPAGCSTTGANFMAAPHSRIRYCSNSTYTPANIVLTDAGDVYGTGTVTHRLVVQPSGNNGGITFGTGTVNWALGVDNTNTYQALSDNTDVRFQQATLNMFYDMGATAATLMSGLTEPTPVDWFPSGATNLVASATLTAGASAVAISGAVSLTASSTLTAGATRTTPGAVSLTATSSLTANAAQEATAATSLTATTTLSVSGVRTTTGSVSILAVPVLSVAVSVGITNGSLALTALGTLSVNGIRVTNVVAGGVPLVSTSGLNVNGTVGSGGGASLNVGSTLLAAGVSVRLGATQLNALPIFVVNGTAVEFGGFALQVGSLLVVSGGVISSSGAITLVASSALTIQLLGTVAGTVALIITPRFAFVEMFPEVDFSSFVRWSTGGIHAGQRNGWSTDGIHTASAWTS